ncbi:MAG TPA: penicillin-binding protein 2 [Chloroflexia bacterium]|jgi:penicillin-binding protein 2
MVEQTNKRSYMTMYVAMAVIFLLLGGKLFHMQILEGNSYAALAQVNRERIVSTKPTRGVIYDRNGQRLVLNNPSYSVAVTAADVPDMNCAAGGLEFQVQESQVFTDLVQTLITPKDGVAPMVAVSDVIALQPKYLPEEKAGEVANRLSVLLQVQADTLRGPIFDTKKNYPSSDYLFPIRKDVAPEVGKAVRAELENLPGVMVFNELQFNFLTRFDNCLKPVVVKRGFDYNTMLRVETEHSALPGVSIVPEPVRQYVDGPLFSHILGYVGPINREDYEKEKDLYEPDDKIGQTGMEAWLEEVLRGSKGAEQVLVDSKERIVSTIASQAPITGNSVSLTLDAELQKSVTAALQDGINKAKVKAGVAVVMRVDNGQVLSLVSLPSYDNNLFSNGISQIDFDRLNTDPSKPMFNRSIGGAYPPGSTYKMITAAAALQEGVVQKDTQFLCPGYIEVPYTWNENTRNPFRDWKAQGHGVVNVVKALTVSSDVFFYIVSGPKQEDRVIHHPDGRDEIIWTRYYKPGDRKPIEFNGLGIQKLNTYARAFGLGSKTGIDLPGEVPGLAPDPDWKVSVDPTNKWSMGDTLVTAIGQGYNLLTPLQLANVTAAVANGGTLYQPQLVLNVTDPSGKIVQDYQPKVIGQVPVSPENLAIVREGMRQVVADKRWGTAANRITLTSIQVAGKTGTAEYGENIGVKNGKEIKRSHAWFTAFAPYEKPEIAVVVLLEGGEESLEGSTFAVPVTDAILKAYFKVDK